jgi:hypothetical protein
MNEVLMGIASTVVGGGLVIIGGSVTASREYRRKRRDDARDAESKILADVLAAADQAYVAGSELAMRADTLAAGAPWSEREPYVLKVGTAVTEMRRHLALVSPGPVADSGRRLADALANLTGEMPTSKIITYWCAIEEQLVDDFRQKGGARFRRLQGIRDAADGAGRVLRRLRRR